MGCHRADPATFFSMRFAGQRPTFWEPSFGRVFIKRTTLLPSGTGAAVTPGSRRFEAGLLPFCIRGKMGMFLSVRNVWESSYVVLLSTAE